MQFTRPQNVWDMTKEQMRQMQPGQWIYAGNIADKGRFLGVKKNGVVVVAWSGNAKARSYYDYVRTLRQFAKNG